MSKAAVMPRVTGLDFESLPIGQRPETAPPEPVSFSLRLPSWRATKFFAWGHKTGGNNTTFKDAQRVLKSAYAELSDSNHVLCHNTKFDLELAMEYMDCPLPPWHRTQDTMFLLFLSDPHQRSLGLKESAQRILGQAPDERDAVVEWILEHKRQLEADYPEVVSKYGGVKPSTAKAFIAYAPGTVVGPYANGDVDRAVDLFRVLWKEVMSRGMGPAYDRERQLMPILMRNEREGLRLDLDRVHADYQLYSAAQAATDDWIRSCLKAPDLDLNKDAQVAQALYDTDSLTEYHKTATGRLSISKKVMKLEHFRNPDLAAAFGYRQKCATALETFLEPWGRYGASGRMHTSWNQVRQSKGGAGDTGGTRTGRPSSDSPNFLNMPKKVEEDSRFRMPRQIKFRPTAALARAIGWAGGTQLPELPRIRGYILPDGPDDLIGRRDYNQQELRVLAHFEDGALLRAYIENPRLDVHDYLRRMILELLGIEVSRTITKNLNFGYIYGQGLGSLALAMNRSVDDVKRFRDAQMRVLPGLKNLSDQIKLLVKADRPITTWGGREYYVEPPMYSEEQRRWVHFDYKLLNYLIQGSSADITKESIIRYDSVRKDGRFMLSVYDENNINVHKKALKREMLILREAMMSIELDVPLMSDGEFGPTLGSMEDLKEPAPNLSRWGIN